MVDNRVNVLNASTSTTWVHNEGHLIAYGNRFTGYAQSGHCTAVRTAAPIGFSSSTVFAPNGPRPVGNGYDVGAFER